MGFDPLSAIADAVSTLGGLVDDFVHTKEEEKADETKRKEIAARVEVANLSIEVARLHHEAALAKAQGETASALARGKSVLQRTLFPIFTYLIALYMGAAWWFEKPVEIYPFAVWLTVAGGGLLDRKTLDVFRREKKESPPS